MDRERPAQLLLKIARVIMTVGDEMVRDSRAQLLLQIARLIMTVE